MIYFESFASSGDDGDGNDGDGNDDEKKCADDGTDKSKNRKFTWKKEEKKCSKTCKTGYTESTNPSGYCVKSNEECRNVVTDADPLGTYKWDTTFKCTKVCPAGYYSPQYNQTNGCAEEKSLCSGSLLDRVYRWQRTCNGSDGPVPLDGTCSGTTVESFECVVTNEGQDCQNQYDRETGFWSRKYVAYNEKGDSSCQWVCKEFYPHSDSDGNTPQCINNGDECDLGDHKIGKWRNDSSDSTVKTCSWENECEDGFELQGTSCVIKQGVHDDCHDNCVLLNDLTYSDEVQLNEHCTDCCNGNGYSSLCSYNPNAG